MAENDQKRNGKISFWKFAFCLMIIALHLGSLYPELSIRFRSGSIAVEFFFLVSGFLYCKKYLNHEPKKSIGETSSDFFIDKVKHFLPYFLLLLILSLPFTLFVLKYSPTDYIRALFNMIYIPVKGNPVDSIYGIGWYIIAMIIVQTILLPFIIKFRKNFVQIVSPMIVFFLGNYLLIKFGTLAGPWQFSIISYSGILRAFVIINLGMLLYLIHDRLKNIQYTKVSKILLTILENIGYLSIFILANKTYAHKFDYFMVIILSISILISFSNKSYLNKFYNNKLFYKLEKLSLPIYLYHRLVIRVVDYIYKVNNLSWNYYITLIIIIIISIVLAIISDILISLFNKNKNKITKLFIKAA